MNTEGFNMISPFVNRNKICCQLCSWLFCTTTKLRVPRTALIISILLLSLIYYTSRSIHELNHMQDFHIKKFHANIDQADYYYHEDVRRPVVWYYSNKKTPFTFLNHVYEIFGKLGYHQFGEGKNNWDVLWAHDYPFEALDNELKNMSPHQKVNHFPGIAFISHKSYLVELQESFVPKAFNIPENKTDFLKYVSRHPNTLWVQKSVNHRKIKIITPKDVDFEDESFFMQEFIANPFLIDNRKFDIGIYTVITSMDPLRVYVFEQEILIRFCTEDYNPFDSLNHKKYVISDDYTGVWEMPSLMDNYNNHGFNRKETIEYFMKQNGHDFDQVMRDIYNQIISVVTVNEPRILNVVQEENLNIRNFFELVRFDFMIDENLRVWLMEVNMSPNLSSVHTPPNKMMYKQVLFNALSLVGLASLMPTSSNGEEIDIEVSDSEIIDHHDDRCNSDGCIDCQSPECQLCYKCMTLDWRMTLKISAQEHINRRQMKRIYPPTITQKDAMVYKPLDESRLSESNRLMHEWFRTKCVDDYAWCL